ncbi:MAG: DEAD/DEAH box helicase, partial [Phycisphaerales bacterium]|nr:DEAD/DEAH box helicase [Phycisphaerales bacterium]
MSPQPAIAAAVGRSVRLPRHFTGRVTIEAVDPFDEVLFLRVRRDNGELAEATVTPAELEAALADAGPGAAARLVPAQDLFLLVEDARIRLSYAYDPHFAVSLSGVEPYPHQLEAVYERMLPQTRLRFLLADDPGAGKTIMAGLLIKELRLRGVLDRVLILCPAPLVVQWQDELLGKFDERFEIVRSQDVRDAVAENPWAARDRVIASIDFAKRDEIRPRVLEAPWDLVIIDEAHKCSARRNGDEVDRTKRYQLAERLSELSERVLLLTATPHQGDRAAFGLFTRLIDPDLFTGSEAIEPFREPDNPWFLRRQKEDLRDFEGRPLFVARHVHSQPFTLSIPEKGLYDAVTEFINTYLPRGSGSKRQSVALARTVFQRRLASSLGAITNSLERRRKRLGDIVAELDGLPPAQQARRLRELRMVEVDDEQEEGDQDEQTTDLLVEGAFIGERIDELRQEVAALDRLVDRARAVRASGEESKLGALRSCLGAAELRELEDGRGKLLIFTEHRDTMEYLAAHLREWGFSVVTIHGGLGAVERRAQQVAFQREAQICVATEAAGEGINLQFCHLMINYDLPWNPNRLEQRMGRIHRIGQRFECHIFNFVATNTVEGRILERLLAKLDEIRDALGDKVFDVVGTLLAIEGVRLEDMLREAAFDPGRIDDYLDQIDRISPMRMRQLAEATERALATSTVDLRHVREADWRSEERRLMPEYVERFFVDAARRA